MLVDILDHSKSLKIKYIQVEFHPIDNLSVEKIINKWISIFQSMIGN